MKAVQKRARRSGGDLLLRRLIDRASRRADDPAVRAWLRALLRGEAAGRPGWNASNDQRQ